MALEKTFRELCDRLRALRDCVEAVELTAREDVPREGSVQAVDSLADAVEDAAGWLEESLTAAVAAQTATGQAVDLDCARRALATSQELFHKTEHSIFGDLLSYERMSDLNAFASSRRGEWRPWVRSLREGLEQCRQPLEEASKAFLACWQEIAERAVARAS